YFLLPLATSLQHSSESQTRRTINLVFSYTHKLDESNLINNMRNSECDDITSSPEALNESGKVRTQSILLRTGYMGDIWRTDNRRGTK
ncbi:hypothetical protein INR49_003970, partial [Caranx melampygus]